MPITTLLEFLKHCNAQASIANIKLYRMALRCWNCILHKKERQPEYDFLLYNTITLNNKQYQVAVHLIMIKLFPYANA